MHRCLVCRSLVIMFACASWASLLRADEKTEATTAPVADETAAAAEDTAVVPDTDEASAELPKYELSYRFTPGQVVHLWSESTAKMTVQVKEATQVDKNASTLWSHYTVVAVAEDGTGTLELQLDKAHQEAQFGDNPPEVFKSDDPEFHHRKFGDTLAMIGRPTALIDYSPHGKLLKVQEPGGAKKVAVRKRPPQDHQGFLIPLPSEPVSVGTIWKDPFQQVVTVSGGLAHTIDMLRVYELKSVEGDLATIGFKTAILTPVHNKEILAQLIQRQTAGTMTLDMRKGLIVAKHITVNESVINALGEGTSMHAVTKFTESVVPGDVVAKNEKPTATDTK